MSAVHGFVVISPNDPSKRGLLFFGKEKAIEHANYMDKRVESHWDIPGVFNKDHWKEKPLPYKVYSLVISEELK